MSAPIRIELPESELRAVIDFIATRENPDEDTPLARAETTMDLALMSREQEEAESVGLIKPDGSAIARQKGWLT